MHYGNPYGSPLLNVVKHPPCRRLFSILVVELLPLNVGGRTLEKLKPCYRIAF